MRIVLAAVAASFLIATVGCQTESSNATSPRLIRVPSQVDTINAAVGQAIPGDVVLLAPGRYDETIEIDRPGITLRGADRNTVVIDGGRERSDGIVVTADDITVENLTVTEHLLNGILVTGMTGEDGSGLARGSTGYDTLDPESTPPVQNFRVRHVTAARNGLYGVYAFHATDGIIESNHASGSADSGIYVGQCKPCRIVVRDNTAEHNAVGFENANASGDLYVLANDFSRNRVGMTVSSDYLEALVPQQQSTVIGNTIADNNEPSSPAHAEGAYGIGIGLAGATENHIERNLITGHDSAGLVITASEDLPSERNSISGNEFADNAVDVANASPSRAPARANCLSGNTAAEFAPATLAAETGCDDAEAQPSGALQQADDPKGVAFFSVELPATQETLTDVTSTDALGPIALPDADDLATLSVPDDESD